MRRLIPKPTTVLALGIGALVYPAAQIVTRLILGRTQFHPDH